MDNKQNNTGPWGKPAEDPASQSQEQTPPVETPVELPEYTFNDLPEALRAGFARNGWSSLMPVQARAIPYILASRDLMIQSRTGSGKTGAYLVPILQRIQPELNVTQALVLVPTRELALQVTKEAEILSSDLGARVIAVYGGVGYGPQLDAFRNGAHLVIGTPGRMLDHLLRRSLNLSKLSMLVFDEADRMLSMGFYPDMKRLQSFLPKHPINTYMFSATFPPRVLALAREFMRSPDLINLSSDHVHVTETEHIFYSVPPMDKERSLLRILEVENPASALIFANTRERVHFVNVILQRYGYNSAEISSDLSQNAREEVMQRIRDSQLRFLVATDVAARGIDLPELSHVILYEPPEDPEDYIHRAGRTGRAGASGVAISLVNPLERIELQRIAKRYTIDLQDRPVPSEEEMQQIVVQRTVALLEARLRSRDRIQVERMQRFLPFLNNLQSGEEAAAGIAMLLDDFYHNEFHNAQLPVIEGKAPTERREPASYNSGERSNDRSSERSSDRSSGGQRSGGRSESRGRSETSGRGEYRGRSENRGSGESQGPVQNSPQTNDRPAAGGQSEAAPSAGGDTRPRRRRSRGGGGRGSGPSKPEAPQG